MSKLVLDNGYKFVSTFWEDFTVADAFGKDAVNETFDRCFKEWKDNVVYATELVITMSIKSCYWYEKNDELSMLYSELYHKIDGYNMDHLKGKDMEFYLNTTD